MLNLNTFNQVAIALVPLAGFITALVQVSKITFNIPQRFIPITACAIGVLVGLVFVNVTLTGAIVGIALGLMSVGLWEVGTNSLSTPQALKDSSNLG